MLAKDRYSSREVTFTGAPEDGGDQVTFKFVKLAGWDSLPVWESLRPALQEISDSLILSEGMFSVDEEGSLSVNSTWEELAKLVLSALGALPPKYVTVAQNKLHPHIQFRRESHPVFTPLAGNEQGAFHGLVGRSRVRDDREGRLRKFSGVISRAKPPVRGGRGDYRPAHTVNIAPFFANPIDAGLCTLTDLKSRGDDGEPRLSIDDVCDLNEILLVRAENQWRANRAGEAKAAKPPIS